MPVKRIPKLVDKEAIAAQPTEKERTETVNQLAKLISKYSELMIADPMMDNLGAVVIIFDSNRYQAFNRGNDAYCASIAEMFADNTRAKLEEVRQQNRKNRE